MPPARDPEREAVLAACPEILDGYGKIALYVGASAWRALMLDDLVRAGWDTAVLEIFPANARFVAKAHGLPVTVGDVRTAPLETRDLCLWLHGPEHIARQDLPATLARLEASHALVVLACPEGCSPQPAVYGNDAEEHRWSVSRADLEILGYNVQIVARLGGNAIVAWKRTTRSAGPDS